MKTLYEITAKINYINTLLVNKREYDSLVSTLEQSLEALELSRPLDCGQSKEIYMQEREFHMQTIAKIKEVIKSNTIGE